MTFAWNPVPQTYVLGNQSATQAGDGVAGAAVGDGVTGAGVGHGSPEHAPSQQNAHG